jgi:hypothetical protein
MTMKKLLELFESEQVAEKAVSQQQQKFMGMVHAMQKGEKIKGASAELKKAAKEMPKKAAKDYASTKHAGLPKKVTEDVMLDEGGNALKHITNRFKHEVKNFMNSGHMADALYDALFDYYLDTGEMPYVVAKGREGSDPYQWVEERFYADMGSGMSEAAPQQDTLSELARLAGLHESKLDECGDMEMDQQDSMNVSTNMSSDGTKNVTISAQGNKADELLSMLKLAGMHHGDDSHEEPSIVLVAGNDDDEMMDEERETQYANTPDEEYETVAAIIQQGNDLNREKRQYADKPKLGDNPMAESVIDEELDAMLESILIREFDGGAGGIAAEQPYRDEKTGKMIYPPKGATNPPQDPVSPAAKPVKVNEPPSIFDREKPYRDPKTGKMVTPPKGLSISEPVYPAANTKGIR